MGNMPEASWRKSTPNDSKVFRENEYRNALNRHYGRLLKLSKKTVGQPSEREVVMLGKIKKLEAQLQEEKELKSAEWDPIRAKMHSKSVARRDRDIQVNIYGLETAIQSISTMDAAFDSVLRTAVEELDEVEEEFRTQTLPGAPSFREKRVRGQARHQGGGRSRHSASTGGIGMVSKQVRRRNSPSGRLPKIKFVQGQQDRQYAQAQRMTTGSQVQSASLVTQLPATEAWGLPVYFSDKEHKGSVNRKGRIKMQQTREGSNLARMMEEEEEQRAVARLIEAEEREADFEKFVILADRFGALDGELFCMSRRPGRLYENLAYASAVLIQIWWKIMWPHRKVVKEAAARLLQRVWRGKQARAMFKYMRLNEDKVRLCASRLFQRLQRHVMDKWREWAHQQVRVKRLMKRVMQGMEKHVMQLWREGALEAIEERNTKLRAAMHRYLNRKKFQVLHGWLGYTQQMLRLKAMMSRRMAAVEHQFFLEWAEYVHDVVWERKRLHGATTIERVGRGMLGRIKWKSRFRIYSTAVLSMQRIVRGHLGRRKFDVVLRLEQRKIRTLARQSRRELLRKELKENQEKEAKRLAKEVKRMEAAAGEAETAVIKEIKGGTFSFGSNPAKKELKQKIMDVTSRYKYEKGKKPSSRKIREMAMAELVGEKREAAKVAARSAFRKKHPVVFESADADMWDELEAEIRDHVDS
jgi:hypothetical protein